MDDQLKKIVEEVLDLEKERTLAKVAEGYERAKRRIFTRIKSYLKDGSAGTTMKLELRNGIARKILTGEYIKGEGDVPIEVALVDDVTGDVVVDEPEASAKVEFFLLNASGGDDSTVEEFIVEGKQPILAGDVSLQLQGGVAAVKNIWIRHRASKIKPPEFKLGARAVGASVRIKEAKTAAFILKDFRTKYYEKHENPSPSAEVSRLDCIRRGGPIDKRLQAYKIYTVEDFLIQLLINPQHLKSIVNSSKKNWQAIVSNAKACLSRERVYCYIDPEQNTGVIFDILGDVKKLFSGSCYSRISTLQSEKEKADAEKLLASAKRHWGQVKAFDDQNSLQQYLAGLSPYTDSTGAGEPSSSMHLDVSFHYSNSIMNLPGDQTGGVQDFAPSPTGSIGSFFAGLDVIDNYTLFHYHDLMDELCADEYTHNTSGDDCCLMNEQDPDEGRDAASQVVDGGRKIWKILFFVLKFREKGGFRC